MRANRQTHWCNPSGERRRQHRSRLNTCAQPYEHLPSLLCIHQMIFHLVGFSSLPFPLSWSRFAEMICWLVNKSEFTVFITAEKSHFSCNAYMETFVLKEQAVNTLPIGFTNPNLAPFQARTGYSVCLSSHLTSCVVNQRGSTSCWWCVLSGEHFRDSEFRYFPFQDVRAPTRCPENWEFWEPHPHKLMEKKKQEWLSSTCDTCPAAARTTTDNLKHWHFHFRFGVYPGKTHCAHMPFFSLVLLHIGTQWGAACYTLALWETPLYVLAEV